MRGSGVILPINQHLHFLKENFVLFVSAAPLHLVIQLGDDLVLELQLDRAGVNNQCSKFFNSLTPSPRRSPPPLSIKAWLWEFLLLLKLSLFFLFFFCCNGSAIFCSLFKVSFIYLNFIRTQKKAAPWDTFPALFFLSVVAVSAVIHGSIFPIYVRSSCIKK